MSLAREHKRGLLPYKPVPKSHTRVTRVQPLCDIIFQSNSSDDTPPSQQRRHSNDTADIAHAPPATQQREASEHSQAKANRHLKARRNGSTRRPLLARRSPDSLSVAHALFPFIDQTVFLSFVHHTRPEVPRRGTDTRLLERLACGPDDNHIHDMPGCFCE